MPHFHFMRVDIKIFFAPALKFFKKSDPIPHLSILSKIKKDTMIRKEVKYNITTYFLNRYIKKSKVYRIGKV